MTYDKRKIESVREGYGKALALYGKLNDKVVVLDADVSNSTLTKYFAEEFPERFFNVGIAEAGMIDTAVGLALEGFIPFANAFASLICYRALEQIRTCVSYCNTNVKIAAGYSGISDYKDGPTHHSIFDLAIMRSMPDMTVLVPADSVEAGMMVKAAAELNGPVYLRLSRADMPVIFDYRHKVKIGRGVTLVEGEDLTICCMGTLLGNCLDAAEKLRSSGIYAGVIEISTLKPFDSKIIVDTAIRTGAMVTVEEHNIIGGLYSAVSECLINNNISIPVGPVGIKDHYACTSLNIDDLYEYMGLSVEDIINISKKVIRKKRK
ncbi:MAG: transketolase family protein [Actinobacteria bacterium]|nr:transketolase family protein [Actinomycetota bacterium]